MKTLRFSAELQERLVERVIWLVRHRPSGRTRRILLGVAVVLFVAVITVTLPQVLHLEIHPEWVLVAAVVSLSNPFVNAVEYWLAGRWVGVSLSPIQAFRVTIVATAANLAPVPGTVLVRGRELYSHGADARDIARSLGSIGAAWVTVAVAAAAIAVAAAGQMTVGVVLVGLALVLAVIPVLALPRTVPRRLASAQCFLLETLSVSVQGVQMYAVLRALGVDATFAQALGFPVAGAVAGAIGVFPGGLGLREVLAGGVAPLLGLAPWVGVVGAATDRIVGLGTLAVMTVLFLLSLRLGIRD